MNHDPESIAMIDLMGTFENIWVCSSKSVLLPILYDEFTKTKPCGLWFGFWGAPTVPYASRKIRRKDL